MSEKVFYASDIEYQQLEDDVMGTTFDVYPYHPAYAGYRRPYQAHWLINPPDKEVQYYVTDGTDDDGHLQINGIDQEDYFGNTTTGTGVYIPSDIGTTGGVRIPSNKPIFYK